MAPKTNVCKSLFPFFAATLSFNTPITIFTVWLSMSSFMNVARSAKHCAARLRVPDLPCSKCFNSVSCNFALCSSLNLACGISLSTVIMTCNTSTASAATFISSAVAPARAAVATCVANAGAHVPKTPSLAPPSNPPISRTIVFRHMHAASRFAASFFSPTLAHSALVVRSAVVVSPLRAIAAAHFIASPATSAA